MSLRKEDHNSPKRILFNFNLKRIVTESSLDHLRESFSRKKKDLRRLFLWSIGIWLVLALIYGLIAYVKSPPFPSTYDEYREIIKTALEKNGYSLLRDEDNHVQFKKKDWSGSYYVDLSTRISRISQHESFKCKLSFYPQNREKRADRWKFVWDTLSENPKFVGVINFIAKTVTQNQITERDIQTSIEQKLEDKNSKSDLFFKSPNGNYSFRIRPYPSKVVCEFSGVLK